MSNLGRTTCVMAAVAFAVLMTISCGGSPSEPREDEIRRDLIGQSFGEGGRKGKLIVRSLEQIQELRITETRRAEGSVEHDAQLKVMWKRGRVIEIALAVSYLKEEGLWVLAGLTGELVPSKFEPARKTVETIRVIATAVESYSIDNNLYPSPGPERNVSELAAVLQPTYVRLLPTEDAWGNAITYSSGKKMQYTISSMGKDGARDQDWQPGGSVDLEKDIVLDTGSMVSWPKPD